MLAATCEDGQVIRWCIEGDLHDRFVCRKVKLIGEPTHEALGAHESPPSFAPSLHTPSRLMSKSPPTILTTFVSSLINVLTASALAHELLFSSEPSTFWNSALSASMIGRMRVDVTLLHWRISRSTVSADAALRSSSS